MYYLFLKILLGNFLFLQDAAGEEDEGDGEILVYENDGVTYTIPIEYLDDSVYDQIFGESDASTHRLGGSLPDLPTGHPSTIFLSSELEDKWKRSGVPYKVSSFGLPFCVTIVSKAVKTPCIHYIFDSTMI